MEIKDYEVDWAKFRKYIEDKAKGRCVINNKNWIKLRDYHFERFIENVPKPFPLLFKMIYMSNKYKNIPCIHRIYRRYSRQQNVLSVAPVNSFNTKTKAYAFKKYR